MPLPIPKLDDRTFDQLVAEGRSLIPRYSPEWTNHNPSDPGITLLELFAWLAEAANFQLDQVPDLSVEHFLKLLDVSRAGDIADKESIDQTIKRALETVARTERAVTRDEFVALAQAAAAAGTPVVCATSGAQSNLAVSLSANAAVTQLVVKDDVFGATDVLRVGLGGNNFEVTVSSSATDPLTGLTTLTVAPVVAGFKTPVDYPEGRPLARTDFTLWADQACAPADYPQAAPLAALIIVVPGGADPIQPMPSLGLKELLFHQLRRRRLLTTRLHVIGPQYVKVGVTVTVVRKPGSGLTDTDVEQELRKFLGPLTGGADATGWPFGRAVYYSEIFQRLESLATVDHVAKLDLTTEPPGKLMVDGVVIPIHDLIWLDTITVDLDPEPC